MKRGTDTARTDGTLGTPDQGEPIYTTDTKALFVGDGSTAGGVPATVPASVIQLTNSGTQDINLSATNNVTWNTESPSWGVDFTWSSSTDPHKITIDTAGTYALTTTVAYTTTTAIRYNGFLEFILNGSTGIGPQSACGYLRNVGAGHDHSSLHVPLFFYTFSAADYVHVQVTREATTSSPVTTLASRSIATIFRVK